jgi:uncharacterized membrane protein YgcG
LEEKTTVEIAVVTVNDLSPYATIDEYAKELFSEWKIGKAKEDNGILIIVSMKERKIRIETGYGIEPIIPDGVAGDIIRNEIAPNFKSGKYGEGLYRGTYAIAERLSKEKGFSLVAPHPQMVEQKIIWAEPKEIIAQTGDSFSLSAVIDDPDGYTNVRSMKSASSDIVTKVYQGEEFYTYVQDGNWWLIRTKDGKVGYMHVSRIRILQ